MPPCASTSRRTFRHSNAATLDRVPAIKIVTERAGDVRAADTGLQRHVEAKPDPSGCQVVPLTYTIDTAQQLVTISGEYATAEEWKDVMGRLVADPRRLPGFAYLRDLRDATNPVDAAAVVR